MGPAVAAALLLLQDPEPVFELRGPAEMTDWRTGGWLLPLDNEHYGGSDRVPVPRLVEIAGAVPDRFADLLLLTRGDTLEAWRIGERQLAWTFRRQEPSFIGLYHDFSFARRVYPGSPAARAGLHTGDVHLWTPGPSRQQFPWGRDPVGRPIELAVANSGGRRTVTLVPEPVPPEHRRRTLGQRNVQRALYVEDRLVLLAAGGLAAVDPDTGRELWRLDGSPVEARGALALVRLGSDVGVVDLRTSRILWQIPCPSWERGPVHANPRWTADGIVVRDGLRTRLVRPETGEILQELEGRAELDSVFPGERSLLLLSSRSGRCWWSVIARRGMGFG